MYSIFQVITVLNNPLKMKLIQQITLNLSLLLPYIFHFRGYNIIHMCPVGGTMHTKTVLPPTSVKNVIFLSYRHRKITTTLMNIIFLVLMANTYTYNTYT